MNRIDFYNVTSDSELTARKFNVVSLILHENKTGKDFRPVIDVPHIYSKGEFAVVFRRTDTVNAAHTAYNNNVIP